VFAARYDVDDIDIIAFEHTVRIGFDGGDAEFAGASFGEIAIEIADHDQLGERRTLKAGQVSGG
jgi:hypothetical protein